MRKRYLIPLNFNLKGIDDMNNKRIGTKFEQDFAEFLSNRGYWVHLVAGNNYTNSQIADIICCKNNNVWLIDCKTLENKSGNFTLQRLEENQRLSYQKFKECGNGNYFLSILWNNNIYFVNLSNLDFNNKKSINVKNFPIIKRGFYEDNN